MKPLRLIPLILLLACQVACKFDFEVHNNAPGGLYVQAVASDEKLSVRFKYVGALGESDKDMKLEERWASVKVSADGVPLVAAAAPYPKPEDLTFFSVDFDSQKYLNLPTGTKLEVSVELDGLESVSGRTAKVGGAALSDLVIRREMMAQMEMATYELSLDAEATDPALEYVGVELYQVQGGPPTWLKPTLAVNTDPNIEMAQVQYSEAMQMLLDDYPQAREALPARNTFTVTIVPMGAFKDGKLPLTVMSWKGGRPGGSTGNQPGGYGEGQPGAGGMLPQPGDSTGSQPGGTGEGGTGTGGDSQEQEPIITHVRVFGVSPEFYRYSLARYKSQSDFLAMMGLAPAQFAWSNISGGFGLCGAVSSSVHYEFSE